MRLILFSILFGALIHIIFLIPASWNTYQYTKNKHPEFIHTHICVSPQKNVIIKETPPTKWEDMQATTTYGGN